MSKASLLKKGERVEWWETLRRGQVMIGPERICGRDDMYFVGDGRSGVWVHRSMLERANAE